MASNIRVVLEVDNKKYIAEVKAASSATRQFADDAAKSAERVSQGFEKLKNSSSGLDTNLKKLRSAILGAAFAGLARSALQMAAQLNDLSDVTGIAVGNLLELQQAIEKAGGKVEA